MSNKNTELFNVGANWRKACLPLTLVAAASGFGLTGCEDPARVASYNLSKAADNFEVERRVVFYNGITDKYMLEIVGKCSIEVDNSKNKLDVTCMVGPKEFIKHYLGLSDNTTYFVEQIQAVDANPYHYRVTFQPQTIIPDVRFNGDSRALRDAIAPGR